jgi:hypothetical protein
LRCTCAPFYVISKATTFKQAHLCHGAEKRALPGARIAVVSDDYTDSLQCWRLAVCSEGWHVQQARSGSCHTGHIHLNRQPYGLAFDDRDSIHGHVGRAAVVYMPVEANHRGDCEEQSGHVVRYRVVPTQCPARAILIESIPNDNQFKQELLCVGIIAITRQGLPALANGSHASASFLHPARLPTLPFLHACTRIEMLQFANGIWTALSSTFRSIYSSITRI